MIWPEIGDKVKIIRMDDPDPVATGTVGVVTEIDRNVGQIWARWPIKGKPGFFVTRPLLTNVDEWEIIQSNPKLLPPKRNATRSNIVLKDDAEGEFWFYKHWDGYPEGNMPIIEEFMALLKEGKIRDNAMQSAGWLMILGLKYDVYNKSGKWKDKSKFLTISDVWTPEDHNDLWTIEPTSCQHGDIDFLYEIDLEKQKVFITEVDSEYERVEAYPKNKSKWSWEKKLKRQSENPVSWDVEECEYVLSVENHIPFAMIKVNLTSKEPKVTVKKFHSPYEGQYGLKIIAENEATMLESLKKLKEIIPWVDPKDYSRNPPESINNPNNIYVSQEAESSTETETGKSEAVMSPVCPICTNIIIEPIKTNPAGAFKCPKCGKAFMPKPIENPPESEKERKRDSEYDPEYYWADWGNPPSETGETLTLLNDRGEMVTYHVSLWEAVRSCGGDWTRFVQYVESCPKANPPKTAIKKLEKIAKEHLGFETLESRNSDSLDFREVSCWGVMNALKDAYDLDREER